MEFDATSWFVWGCIRPDPTGVIFIRETGEYVLGRSLHLIGTCVFAALLESSDSSPWNSEEEAPPPKRRQIHEVSLGVEVNTDEARVNPVSKRPRKRRADRGE